MQPVFENYFNELQELHASIEKAIAGLGPDALDFTPGPDMNSLAVLIMHLTGAERYLIGDVAGREPSGRVRAKEFEARGLTEADLRQRLAEVLAHSRSVLERLTVDDLVATTPITGPDGRSFTVAHALFHALSHASLHAGHVQLTRQLLDERRRSN